MSDELKPGTPVMFRSTGESNAIVGVVISMLDPTRFRRVLHPDGTAICWRLDELEPVDVLPEWASSWVIPPGHVALPAVDLDNVAAMIDAHEESKARPVLATVEEGMGEWVSLPVPPDGTAWRLMPDGWHENFMDPDTLFVSCEWRQGGRSQLHADTYRELNADPVPVPEPIGPGDWIIDDGAADTPLFVMHTLGNNRFVTAYDVGGSVGWEVETEHHEDRWRRCTPEEVPTNAGELYDLLGYPKCTNCLDGEDCVEAGGVDKWFACAVCGGAGFLIPGAQT